MLMKSANISFPAFSDSLPKTLSNSLFSFATDTVPNACPNKTSFGRKQERIADFKAPFPVLFSPADSFGEPSDNVLVCIQPRSALYSFAAALDYYIIMWVVRLRRFK